MANSFYPEIFWAEPANVTRVFLGPGECDAELEEVGAGEARPRVMNGQILNPGKREGA